MIAPVKALLAVGAGILAGTFISQLGPLAVMTYPMGFLVGLGTGIYLFSRRD